MGLLGVTDFTCDESEATGTAANAPPTADAPGLAKTTGATKAQAGVDAHKVTAPALRAIPPSDLIKKKSTEPPPERNSLDLQTKRGTELDRDTGSATSSAEVRF